MTAPAQAPSDFYVTGGTMRPDAPSYVERASDHDLYAALSAGEFAYVLTSRQMGKSSLIVRTAARLRDEGVAVAALDLAALGQNLAADQWYAGLLNALGQRLDLEDELEQFWDDNQHLGPLHRWMEALRQVVLAEAAGRVVVFVDEIDVVQSLPFSTGEFFAAIRECYTRRAEQPDFERLTFCLVGVATPAQLIDDPLTTPFNIGVRIELRDFDAADAAILAQGLSVDAEAATNVVGRVLHWTGGHPYLTQRLCQLVLEAECVSPADVDRIVSDEFFSDRAREQEPNLQFVHGSMIGRDVDTAALLTLYRRVLRSKPVRYDETNPLINVLQLSGIIRVDDKRVHVRNPVYARVFDRAWVDENMPGAELRRQKAAYRRGVLQAAIGAAVVLAVVTGLGLYAYSLKGELATRLIETQGLLVEAQLARANDRITPNDPTRLFDILDAWELSDQASGGATSLASIWAVQHARVSRGLAYAKSTPAATFDMKVSSDGAFAAAGYGDGSVHVWVCATGEPLGSAWHDAPVHELRLVGGDRYLVVGLTDGSVYVWSLATYARVGPPLPHPVPMVHMDVVVDDTLITQHGGHELTVRRWDVVSGELRSTCVIPVQGVRDVRAWRNGRLVSYFSADVVGVHDLDADETVSEMPLTAARGVREWKQTDERLMLAVGADGLLSVDAAGTLAELPSYPAGSTARRFSRDGSMLAIAYDGTTPAVQLWDVASGQPTGEALAYTGSVDWWAFDFYSSPDRVLLETHADTTSTLFAWDLRIRQQLVELAMPRVDAERTFVGSDVAFRVSEGGSTTRALRYAPRDHVTILGRLAPEGNARMAVSRDGRQVAFTNSASSAVLVGDAMANDMDDLEPIGVGGAARSIAWRPDGAAVATVVGDQLLVLELGPGNVAGRVDDRGEWSTPVYDPAGRVLAACDTARGIVRFWDADSLSVTGSDVVLPAGAVADARNIAFSPDGSLLASGQDDGYVRLWDVRTRTEVASALNHGGTVNCVTFSPNGRYLASTNWSGETAKVWDVEAGVQVGGTLRHKGVVWGAAFHPGGQLLVVESNDLTATLWHWQTGTNLTAYVGHPAGVGDAAFTPDGRTLFTMTISNRDRAAKVVRRWDFPRVPTSAREAEVRTSLFTGVRRVGPDDTYVVLTPQDWRDYQAELAGMDERPTPLEEGSHVRP